ncbi:MAG TPA: hypothetical protein VFZ58_00880 [Candidatus Saccharimonadales bacterium]
MNNIFAQKKEITLNLASRGIEMGELSLWRRIFAFPAATCCAEKHRGRLDLRTPVHITKADTRSGLVDLRSLLLSCSDALKGSEHAEEQAHGVFKILEVLPLPADKLHAATAAQLLLETEKYIRPLCFGFGEPRLPLDDNEIELDPSCKPTVQIDFESLMVFDITAKVPDECVIDLSISYPDYPHSDRRPIDEIDTFLTALYAQYRGARAADRNFIDSGEMRHWVRDPQRVMPEHWGSAVFEGWKYVRIGGGYNFEKSWLQLAQGIGSNDIDRCLHPVLEEFRRQLVKRVPSLCS